MKRSLKKQDLADIRRGVRKLYNGPGIPLIEIGEKHFLDKTSETFFNHGRDRIGDREFDLHDMMDLNSALSFSRKGDPELQISPGFIFDLYIYEGAWQGNRADAGDNGDMWGNLDAEWTGTEWRIVDPFAGNNRA